MLLGIDVGTTHTKASLFTAEGEERFSSVVKSPAPPAGLPPGWAEYDIESVWQGVVDCLRRLAAEAGPAFRAVRAVAVSSVAESGVLMDREGRPLGPMIAWYDVRAREQVAFMAERVGAERMVELTGMPLQPKFSLYHLLWWKKERPEAFGRAERWLHVADYVAYRLSGEAATDPSLACRTAAFDLARGEWCREILDAAGVPASLLPPVHSSGTPLGRVRGAVAAETGLDPRVVVAVGGHDHICAALSAGAVRPGVLLDSKGTAEAVLASAYTPAADERVRRNAVAVGRHVYPGRFTYLRGQPSGGRSIEWAMGLLGIAGSYEAFRRLCDEAPAGPTGIVYLPNATGTPNDPATGFIGLHWHKDRAALAKSVLEGLACELRRIVELMPRGEAGGEVVRVVGGGARLEPWLRLTADVLGLPVDVSPIAEAACHGAALLGGVGAGVYAGHEEASRCVARGYRRVEPDARAAALYTGVYAQYLSLRERLAAA